MKLKNLKKMQIRFHLKLIKCSQAIAIINLKMIKSVRMSMALLATETDSKVNSEILRLKIKLMISMTYVMQI